MIKPALKKFNDGTHKLLNLTYILWCLLQFECQQHNKMRDERRSWDQYDNECEVSCPICSQIKCQNIENKSVDDLIMFNEIWHSLRNFGLTRNKKTLCDDFGCTRLYATSALKVYYVIDICHILRPAPITRDPANPPWFIQEHSSKSKTERISGCANRLKKG